MTRSIDAEQSFRLLITKDDPGMVELMGEVASKKLGIEKYEIKYASSDSELYRKLKAGRTDLIVVDIHIKGKHMLHVIRELKSEDSIYKNIPIIVVTGESSIVDACIEFGADKVVLMNPKTFNEDYGNALEELLVYKPKKI